MQHLEADSLSEQIAKHISEQIIRGELVEGERIQELRIASELDVSRGSVREALLILERTQLIEIFPAFGWCTLHPPRKCRPDTGAVARSSPYCTSGKALALSR